MNRPIMLQRLRDETEWDIIIIGGGATGLGTAVDAATRGYKTLLVEQFDFGKGTSSRSTKLVHGGVRYLAQGNIKLVLDALHERGYLLKNAPHLTTALPFIVPSYGWFSKWYYGIGLKVYDLLSGKLSLGKTRFLNKKETLQQLPGISDKKLKGGVLYYDGQFDDARLAIELAVTAAKHGATILNYCKANALIKAGKKIAGVVIEDIVNHTTYKVKSKAVINATGVFTDAVMQMDEPEKDMLVMPSQGVHLVVDKHFFPGTNALMIPKTDDGRVLFAVPWHDKVVLGTTDTAVDKISFEPEPLEEEIEFVLKHANRYFKKNITRSDVRSMFAGLRPLVKKKAAQKTSFLSRDHIIIVSKSGLVTITGGKWTTYRKMAEDAVDNAVFIAKLSKRDCITKHLAIGNKEDAYIKEDGNNFIHPSFHFTKKDIERFIQNEMAMTVEDVLARRTRLLFLDARAAINAAPSVAKAMATVMNKDEQWINEQVNSFTRLAKQYCIEECKM
jgi:glycerol-3-phosphate dehydrogenase